MNTLTGSPFIAIRLANQLAEERIVQAQAGARARGVRGRRRANRRVVR